MSMSSRALVATATIALLAGCSGGSATSPISRVDSQNINHQNAQQSLSRAQILAKTLLVKPGLHAIASHGPIVVSPDADFAGVAFVGDAGANEVYRITAKGKAKPVGSGWSEPQGIGVDPVKGNVYVADTANSRVVELSKAGKPIAILSDPGEYPASVAVAENGTVGVTNILSTSGGTGDVAFYAAGATKAKCSISGGLSSFGFIAVDASDNFYFDATDGSVDILATAKPCGTISNTGISPSGGALQVWKSGTGKKATQTLGWGHSGGSLIDLYSLPSYAPDGEITLGGVSDAFEFAIAGDQKYIAEADAGAAVLDIWSFPAGGSSPSAAVTGFSLPIGVGFAPSGDE